MLFNRLDAKFKSPLLLALTLALSPSVVNANNINVETNAIPKISSEYFSNMNMKPRFWIGQTAGKSINQNDIRVGKDLILTFIGNGINVPEYALKLVITKDHVVRLDRVDD
ncbi:MAG: hypothetical protein D4R39_00085 [Methylophilaceae bacterium]|nr:MAG: hypothetical protein D4R39_00085 [Methylophilaceae bacterium]